MAPGPDLQQPVLGRAAHEDTYPLRVGYCDGGVFGQNPSRRGVYWSLLVEGFPVIRSQDPGYHTNNDAEWLAVRGSLQWAVEHEARQFLLHSDSRLVVDCFNERIRTHVERHMRFFWECKRLEARLAWMELRWVPRKLMVAKVGH